MDIMNDYTLARAMEDSFSAKIPAAFAYSGARACTEGEEQMMIDGDDDDDGDDD